MKWMYFVKIITLRCSKCQQLWKCPIPMNLSPPPPNLHIVLHSSWSTFGKCVWKEEVRTRRWDGAADRRFILKTDYCFLTTQWLAFNLTDHTGWIALLILSFPTATAGSEEGPRGNPVLSQCSIKVETWIRNSGEMLPAGQCDRHFKYRMC